ncbi:MAG: multicomponent Na+:H+ antiporter subunit D [Spirochaetes bacterium]|nr:MAG: multicomponent Na+:H+ antiporter subunit D [Spirochaetota bacterium]
MDIKMDISILALLPTLLPLFAGALILIAKAFLNEKAQDRTTELAGIIGLLLPWIPMMLLLPRILAGESPTLVIGGWSYGTGIFFKFDGLAWALNALTLLLCAGAWVYSRSSGPRGPVFTIMFLIQVASCCAAMSTLDVFNLFVCMEVMGMTSYVLIAQAKTPGSYVASFTYLMSSAATMLLFLIGVYGLYRLTGALDYNAIQQFLSQCSVEESRFASLCAICMIIPIVLRAAIMPLSGWLLLAHSQAPHSISAVLSGVLLKVPLFALVRLLLIFPSGGTLGLAISFAGALGALLAVLLALVQSDAKRLLAYHSISQTGYVAAALGAAIAPLQGSNPGLGLVLLVAAYLHALGHGIFKGLLFLSVGNLMDVAKQRNVYLIQGGVSVLKRSGDSLGLTGFSFAVGALSIAAMPPFIGFATKGYISKFLAENHLYGLLAAASVLTVASFIKLSRIFVSFPSSSSAQKTESNQEAPMRKTSLDDDHPHLGSGRLSSVVGLALLCIAGGLLAPQLFRFGILLFDSLLQGSPSLYPLSVRPPELFVLNDLTQTALTIPAGLIISLLISSKTGQRLTHGISGHIASFETIFLGMGVALIALAIQI